MTTGKSDSTTVIAVQQGPSDIFKGERLSKDIRKDGAAVTVQVVKN